LTGHIAELEARLEVKIEQCARLNKELEVTQELCRTLEGQAGSLNERKTNEESENRTVSFFLND